MQTPNFVEDAVAHAGTQAKLAQQLGVSQQAVSVWLRRGWVPTHRAQEIEAQYGIPRKKLMNRRLVDLLEPSTATDFEA